MASSIDTATELDAGRFLSALKNMGFASCLKSRKEKDFRVAFNKNALFYKTNPRRGYVLIFNHIDFDPELMKRENFGRRDPGTIVDAQMLTKTFSKLGFEVILREESQLTFEKVESTLEEVRKKDFAEYDCLFLFVLSHGCADKIFTYDKWYPIELLVEKFTGDKCRGLAAKPKILVLNLCRGRNLDPGIDVRVEVDGEGSRKCVYRLPVRADFLIACSTIPGYESFLDPDGSCYVKALCKVFDEYAATGMDIVGLLTTVNRRVTIEYEAKDEFLNFKQVPYFSSMLTRMLKFRSK